MMSDDNLTLTLRLHDPKERTRQSAEWVVQKVARADLAMPLDEFIAKYVKPAFGKLAKVTGK